jgi:cyclopropane fatty-acyl-phospholipid synthase-like methyltransferase
MSEISNLQTTENSLNYSNEIFNSQWELYQKILNNNYMEHKEFYGILHNFIINYFQKPFTMLELGCGDASFSVQALLNSSITAYSGIDLSNTALEIANNNMALIDCEKNFTLGNFSTVISEISENKEKKFDLILASFTLHHLTLEEKESIIGKLGHLLNEDGVFILIDITRKEKENREDYLKRYLNNINQHWSILKPEEISMVDEHISSSDFPETEETLFKIGRHYNFSSFECLYSDSCDTSKLLCFYR